jgi:hypothetical protein
LICRDSSISITPNSLASSIETSIHATVKKGGIEL